jgi:hypothetical protein
MNVLLRKQVDIQEVVWERGLALLSYQRPGVRQGNEGAELSHPFSA